jgi:hypothetical protein
MPKRHRISTARSHTTTNVEKVLVTPYGTQNRDDRKGPEEPADAVEVAPAVDHAGSLP